MAKASSVTFACFIFLALFITSGWCSRVATDDYGSCTHNKDCVQFCEGTGRKSCPRCVHNHCDCDCIIAKPNLHLKSQKAPPQNP
ncbi:hypothetical protein K1719_016371 [Acacia pycnantha]|nr:hypothetical protein K1719_016371 [Acacia pycnantha]